MSTNLEQSAAVARGLPKRQRQVLCCLANGMLVKETADKLKISEKTVKNTRTTIYQKLCVRSGLEAVRVACQAGIL